MAVGEYDMTDALDGRGLVGDERGIAGEERVEQNRVPCEIKTESGVAIPGDLHDGPYVAPDFGVARNCVTAATRRHTR